MACINIHMGARGFTVAVVGASGYAGAEVVRLLSGHPEFTMGDLAARSQAGATLVQVMPHLGGVAQGRVFPILTSSVSPPTMPSCWPCPMESPDRLPRSLLRRTLTWSSSMPGRTSGCHQLQTGAIGMAATTPVPGPMDCLSCHEPRAARNVTYCRGQPVSPDQGAMLLRSLWAWRPSSALSTPLSWRSPLSLGHLGLENPVAQTSHSPG